MDTAYWFRQSPLQSAILPKRQRTETDVAAGDFINQEAQIFPLRNEHSCVQSINDTQALVTLYDRYLQDKQQLSSYGVTQAGLARVNRSTGGEISGYNEDKPFILSDPTFRSFGPPKLVANDNMPLVDPMIRPVVTEREIPLPLDASNTLFVEGLPRDATEREVAHIFRPFLGYKEVRLVNKQPKYDGGSSILLCFVDFETPSHAMVAMDAIEDAY